MKTIPFGRPMIGKEEKEAVSDVLDGQILVHGPKTGEFEAAFASYVKASSAVSVSSCTAGLHLFYFNRGIRDGDEVIVPAQTHVATAHVVELCGAKPVFVDAEIGSGNIDINQIEAAITDKTKAVSVVHFLGMPVDMTRINAIAQKHGLLVIEDCALAIGARLDGCHVGLHGDIGSFSFYPVKHMTTAEGGMLISQHDDILKLLSRQKAFGVDRHMGERKIPGEYDVKQLGFNYRLNEIQAAIGIEQVKRLPDFLARRKSNYIRLHRQLAEVEEVDLFESSHDRFESSYYCLSVLLKPSLVDKRFEIIQNLKRNGIGTSIYYPRPVPHFTYYREKYGYQESSFPVAARISYCSIALPVGPHLSEEDMDYIVYHLKSAIKEAV